MPERHAAPTNTDAVRPERVEDLSREIRRTLNGDISALRGINTQTRLVSLNARIEAARAGDSGLAFAVVANEVMDLSRTMDDVFRRLEVETTPMLEELNQLGAKLARDVRGQRLADLAAAHLDVVDRNLYERSCDVRWWATDEGLVRALSSDAPTARQYAADRMGTILDSYTVYFDLVLCNLEGRVIANGRPSLFRSVGMDMHQQTWFQSALKTASGAEFGFEGMHASPLVGGQRVLVYSTAVRQDGRQRGTPVGVLGVVYRWEDLGQKIVNTAALSPEEAARTRVMILETSGRVIACSGNLPERDEYLPASQWLGLSASARFHAPVSVNGKQHLLGMARSQGFETYATGWSSLLLQQIG
jgi:hypothetical protein